MRRVAVPVAVLVVLALVPKFALDLPYVFQDSINTPGTLQLLALCLTFGGLAMTYDLLFGFTGLLSFGHALYFAVGVYLIAVSLTKWHWTFAEGIAFAALVGVVLPLVLGSVSLRVGGIAFAMVTLAFAQAGSILAFKNPFGWTGGEEGLGTDYTRIPHAFVGILNTKNLYWLALAYAVVVFVVIRFANPKGIDFPYLTSMLHGSWMSRPNNIVVPGGKMGLAMQLIFTPMILRLVERRKKLLAA